MTLWQNLRACIWPEPRYYEEESDRFKDVTGNGNHADVIGGAVIDSDNYPYRNFSVLESPDRGTEQGMEMQLAEPITFGEEDAGGEEFSLVATVLSETANTDTYKIAQYSEFNNSCGLWNRDSSGISFGVRTSNERISVRSGHVDNPDDNYPLLTENDVFHTAVGVSDPENDEIRLYVDGQLAGTADLTELNGETETFDYLNYNDDEGSSGGSGLEPAGGIVSMMVYDRALTRRDAQLLTRLQAPPIVRG